MSIDQLMGFLQVHEEKLLKKNKQMTEQLFQSKLKLKDKEDSLEKGNRGRGHGGNHGRGDFKDRGQEATVKENLMRVIQTQIHQELEEDNIIRGQKGKDQIMTGACKGAKTCENSAWYLDSGASNHMCGSKSLFVELDESVGGDIVFGDAKKFLLKAKSCLKDPNWIWHMVKGYSNFDDLRLLARKNMVKGLPYVKHPDQLCEEASQNDKWKIAMNEEIKVIKKNDKWELSTLPNGKKAVGVKWVFKIKRNEKGEVERYKARLVAKGYSQRKGIDYDEVFALVACLETIRLLITLDAQNNWKILALK
ncbi:reverse transcriptase [Cucumis melo var. makuwa]|uniref:Reverse transcriptase n=1 Tax=Cucumis melo var. makuwa TaxID=1194695 RepID=A0A5A7UD36_CUCMM|nr:reverse transcriptase [Cucumis melo var. makuwa]